MLETIAKPQSPAHWLDARDAGFVQNFRALLATIKTDGGDVEPVVKPILKAVAEEGDAAVLRYTQQFDSFALTRETMRVGHAEIANALASVPADILSALRFAHARILAFHQKQLPQDYSYTDDAGVKLGWRWRAIEAVGLYVPGGTASYPSSVLMNAVPAKVAGVPRVVMVAPAPQGALSPLSLAAAHIAGVDEIYRIGGAQAIAALAYGTETLAPVVKIVGPGNAYVACAKRLVFGLVGIDTIAGPSEVVVVADSSADAQMVAADLLAQAEHDVLAQSILITTDEGLATRVCAAVEAQLKTLPREKIARQSWQTRGVVIVVEILDDSVALIDALAPEHLELMVENPEALSAKIRNAGAIFLGSQTPEAIGDYVGGPNHVLPTARAARYAGGLNVLDFMKRTTLLSADGALPLELAEAAQVLARAEGLEGHARSVKLRTKP